MEEVVFAGLPVIEEFYPTDPKVAEDEDYKDNDNHELDRLHYIFHVQQLHDLVVVTVDVVLQANCSHYFVSLYLSY